MAITEFDNTYATCKFTVDTSLTSATSQNITNGAATLYSLTVNNVANTGASSSVGEVYLKVYDSLPDGGIIPTSTEPDYIFVITRATTQVISFPSGLPIANGLSLRCVSSAQTNQVGVGNAVIVTAIYK
tara:strand:- start:132 stop:518 length:387 start_codon:yes stop_codon:yes gene_type:complete